MLIVRAPAVPILMSWATELLPILITPPLELIETAPVESKLEVVELKLYVAAFNWTVCPEPLRVNWPPVEVTVTPDPPLTVNKPEEVVMLEALDESMLKVTASRFTAVADAEPTWTVRAPCWPMLMFWATALLPMLITPELDSKLIQFLHL